MSGQNVSQVELTFHHFFRSSAESVAGSDLSTFLIYSLVRSIARACILLTSFFDIASRGLGPVILSVSSIIKSLLSPPIFRLFSHMGPSGKGLRALIGSVSSN